MEFTVQMSDVSFVRTLFQRLNALVSYLVDDFTYGPTDGSSFRTIYRQNRLGIILYVYLGLEVATILSCRQKNIM
jgi:hypothetical protein